MLCFYFVLHMRVVREDRKMLHSHEGFSDEHLKNYLVHHSFRTTAYYNFMNTIFLLYQKKIEGGEVFMNSTETKIVASH